MDVIENTLKSEVKFEGKIINLSVKEVELPNGKTAYREIVNHPGGVAVIAFKDENTLLMIEQFRSPIEKVLLEIPAGKLEKDEDIELCGRRELEEETGYKAETFTYLGKIVPSPGYTDEYIYLYKAENLFKGNVGGDDDEFINLLEIDLNVVKEMVKSGKIIDAKTICALMYL
ncbi:NUDIX hydrolase [Clostridium sediminicola]|uniref:NUDIX hydrolase n=1 Tax=Clostridium sediminicola TaxID=3114879 RepID=UPI0031F20B02